MNKILLVSLVSDQTIPNVQLINELKDTIDNYLFISTRGMELKGVRNWIIEACELEPEKLLPHIEVNQFSFDDIEQKLDQIDFDDYFKVIVNLTGGTKVMTLASFDYFKEIGADIFYLTGSDDELIKLAPGRKKKSEKLDSKVDVVQYLKAYGFTIKETTPSSITTDYTEILFSYFVNGAFLPYKEVLNSLRKHRKKGVKFSKIDQLENFLSAIEFPISVPGELTELETKYLTGEWFEENIAYKIQKELELSNNEIKTGLVISKRNKNGEMVPNEMDVVFTWKNKIYTIECKTSIFYEELQSDGKIKMKSLLGETLYKSDSLRQGFGLYVSTFIFVLDDIEEQKTILKDHLERAELFHIKIADKSQIVTTKRIRDLIGI